MKKKIKRKVTLEQRLVRFAKKKAISKKVLRKPKQMVVRVKVAPNTELRSQTFKKEIQNAKQIFFQ